jgi:hypothetical protein
MVFDNLKLQTNLPYYLYIKKIVINLWLKNYILSVNGKSSNPKKERDTKNHRQKD